MFSALRWTLFTYWSRQITFATGCANGWFSSLGIAARLTATNGAEGLHLAQTEQPQLICLDLAMPALSGWAVLHQLRADPALQTIPVIVITSITLTAAESQQLLAQHVEFVAKAQLSRATLWAAIHRSVNNPALPEEL